MHPMKWKDGTYLWDGGMSISVPADITRDMGVDIVIAVNVDADYFSSAPSDLDMNIIKIAYHGIDMFRYHLAKYNVQNADIVIEPKLGEMAWYDLSTRKQAIEAGEVATQRQIKRIKSLFRV
jgi:NTE family protein